MRAMWIAVTVAALCVPAALGQTAAPPLGGPQRAVSAAEEIAPLVDQATALVVRWDPSKVNVDAVLARIRSALAAVPQPPSAKEIADVEAQYRRNMTAFQAGGGRCIYYLLSLHMPLPAVVISMAPGAQVEKLKAALKMTDVTGTLKAGGTSVTLYAERQIGSLLYIGPPQLLPESRPTRLPTSWPAMAPPRKRDVTAELSAGFAAAGTGAVQAVWLPGALAHMPTSRPTSLPAVPGLDASLTPDWLLVNLRWVAAGITSPPSTRVTLTVQMADADAAKRLHAVASRMLATWRKIPPNQQPALFVLGNLLSPQVTGSQVRLALTDFQADSILFTMTVPAMYMARLKAEQGLRVHQVHALAKSCQVYAMIVSDGRWPQTLDQLIEKQFATPEMLKQPTCSPHKGGYVYLRPADGKSPRAGAVLIHEAYEQWHGGIAVAFSDGTSRFITDEAEFKKLLAASTAPETP